MNDLEFEVLDELYFVQSFAYLQKQLQLEEQALREILRTLLQKEWIKCFKDGFHEIPDTEADFDNKYQDYHYLATKKGLLAHNS